MTDERPITFTKAITRKPCRALIDGITTGMFADGKPDYEKAVAQHDRYLDILRELGLAVTDLPADERYPDSCFVEDPAVVTPELAVLTNPACASRNGEKEEMREVLRGFYPEERIFPILAPGTMEGGDVMLCGREFYVGLSGRTNAEGIRQFTEIVRPFGYSVTAVPVTEGLHLKDFVIYLEHGNMLVNAAMNEVAAFRKYRRFVIPPEELYAINSLYINGSVLVPAGFPRTRQLIGELGYPVIPVDTGEFSKIDGSLTCLSLRF